MSSITGVDQGRGEYVRLALEEAGSPIYRRRARTRHGVDDADYGRGRDAAVRPAGF